MHTKYINYLCNILNTILKLNILKLNYLNLIVNSIQIINNLILILIKLIFI